MKYKVEYTKKAKQDLEFHQRSGNKAILNKIESLSAELSEHPRTGTGKPEQLKYGLAGQWSRRINSEHRLLYTIEDDRVVVEVLSAKGHY